MLWAVNHQLAALIGIPAEQLRVVRQDGVEVLFGLFGPNGSEIHRGPITEGSELVIPAEVPADDSATYFVYFDNPLASAVPDFLTLNDARLRQLDSGQLRVRALETQHMRLGKLGNSAASQWHSIAARRAQVNVFNFRDQPASDQSMVAVDLEMIRRRAKGQLNMRSLQVKIGERALPHLQLGDSLLFHTPLASRSVAHLGVYFSDGADERVADAPDTPIAADLTNLVQNGQFDEGQPQPSHWESSGSATSDGGVRMTVDHQLRAGVMQACARMDVASDLPEQWRGWRQQCPCNPAAPICWPRGSSVLIWATEKYKSMPIANKPMVNLRSSIPSPAFRRALAVRPIGRWYRDYSRCRQIRPSSKFT